MPYIHRDTKHRHASVSARWDDPQSATSSTLIQEIPSSSRNAAAKDAIDVAVARLMPQASLQEQIFDQEDATALVGSKRL